MESKKRKLDDLNLDQDQKQDQDQKPKLKKQKLAWKQEIASKEDINFSERRPGFDFTIVSNQGDSFYCSSLYIVGGPFNVINSTIELSNESDSITLDLSSEAVDFMLNWTCRAKYDNDAWLKTLNLQGITILGNVGLRYDCNELVSSCLNNLYLCISSDQPTTFAITFCEQARGDLPKLALSWLLSDKSKIVAKEDIPATFWSECYKLLVEKNSRIEPSNFLRLMMFQENGPIDDKYIVAFFNLMMPYVHVKDRHNIWKVMHENRDHDIVRQFQENAFLFIQTRLAEE